MDLALARSVKRERHACDVDGQLGEHTRGYG